MSVSAKSVQGFEVVCEIRGCGRAETFVAFDVLDAVTKAVDSGRWRRRDEGGRPRLFCPAHKDSPVPFYAPGDADVHLVHRVLRGEHVPYTADGWLRIGELAAMYLVSLGLEKGAGSWTKGRLGKLKFDPALDHREWLARRGDRYSVWEVESVEEVYRLFPGDAADEMNWLFLSTSGVHGSYTTLDELVFEHEDPGQVCADVTVLVVQPRLARIAYGNVEVTPEDVPRLRKIVDSTLAAVRGSQAGNLPKKKSPKKG